MKSYRTFIGLPVKVSERFLEARQELMESLSGERISWVDPDRYHITLRFIGKTDINAIDQIGKALGEKVNIPQRSHVSLTQTGSFGPRKKPRVIWIGLEHTTIFESLKDDVDRVLQSCGIPSVDGPFRAHLTLGRVRSLKDLNGYYETVSKMEDRFKEFILLDKLVFYRSELGNGGPVYIPLCQMEFQD
ncbi:MAG: RNA 2',3'-cyclic phosphodiesterase [Bacteroidota bacterium]